MWASRVGASCVPPLGGRTVKQVLTVRRQIVHVFPTSGGPYHFAAILSPPEYANGIAWVTGWLGCAGWVTLTATTGSLAGSLLLGAYALAHPEYNSESYQTVIVFIGFIVSDSLPLRYFSAHDD